MAKLSVIMNYMRQIDRYIVEIRQGMSHTSPYSVDALRRYIDELEEIKDVIMRSDLQSGANLDTLMDKVRACMRECLRPSYAAKPEVLPNPKPDPYKEPPPPVTVTGVNIIMVCDISDSMFERGGLNKGGRVRNLLIDFAKEIEATSIKAKIPCKVSLVVFSDPTDNAGANKKVTSAHPNGYWDIVLNKAKPATLDNAFSSINRKKYIKGNDNEEAGMTAMHKAIDKVIDKSIVNGKPVENSIILVSDERQKMKDSQHTPDRRHSEVTLAQLEAKFDKLKIQNRYGLIPMTKGYNYFKSGYPVVTLSPQWNKDSRKFFRQTREYWSAKELKHIQDWVTWTLDPTKAPKK